MATMTRSSLPAILLVVLAALLAGCATSSNGGPHASDGEANAYEHRPAPTRSSRVVAELTPWGQVPYDRLTLPLVSPDGQFIATQANISPTWPTVLAEHDAEIPVATQVQIHRFDDESSTLQSVTNVDQHVLLGRSVNSEGFLVEAPQEDGSRWIGLADWESGDIQWLVQDEHVNAFASLGPDGRLAWCRRPVDGPEHMFELVIRTGGREWVHGGNDEASWLMPTWSGTNDGLFAMMLQQQRLSAVYGVASDAAAFGQSQRRISLATGASVLLAYQSISAQAGTPADRSPLEQFVFYHPSRACMAIWRPRSSNRTALTMFDMYTFAAVMDDDPNYALVTTEEHLLRQNVREPRDKRQLIAGVQVARPTNAADRRFVLLSPYGDAINIVTLNSMN